MATPSVLAFDAEGRAIDFDVWVDDLQLFLQCDRADGLSLSLTSPLAPLLPLLLMLTPLFAPIACYSSPATAALSRLLLPYLFPDLAAFSTVADLITHLRTSDTRYCAAPPADFCTKNPPPMYITLYYIVTRLPDSLRVVRDHFLSVCPTTLTVDLLVNRGQPGSSLYTLTTPSPPVAESGRVATSGQVFAAASRSGPESAPCSCRLLSHETLLWHHRLGHPSLLRLRGMASRFLVSGLPRSLPPLPQGPGPTCVPCVEGHQRAAPHSSQFPPTEAPLQTLHMDVWGPARVRGQGHERYFLLVVSPVSIPVPGLLPLPPWPPLVFVPLPSGTETRLRLSPLVPPPRSPLRALSLAAAATALAAGATALAAAATALAAGATAPAAAATALAVAATALAAAATALAVAATALAAAATALAAAATATAAAATALAAAATALAAAAPALSAVLRAPRALQPYVISVNILLPAARAAVRVLGGGEGRGGCEGEVAPTAPTCLLSLTVAPAAVGGSVKWWGGSGDVGGE
ncbi:unnamed protein product [Closterium sp. NIES-53]